jgi:hypothetical protein
MSKVKIHWERLGYIEDICELLSDFPGQLFTQYDLVAVVQILFTRYDRKIMALMMEEPEIKAIIERSGRPSKLKLLLIKGIIARDTAYKEYAKVMKNQTVQ